jgi:hypothetical protein
MRSKTTSVLLAATAAAAAALATTSAANAAASAGGLRLGEHQNLGGQVWFFDGSRSSIGGANDEASSALNDDTVAWVVYQHSSYRGRELCLTPGRYIADFHGSWLDFGDKISSVKRLGTSSCEGHPQP